VPGVVKVAWNVSPVERFGELPGVLAPLGTEVKAISCTAALSWSVQVIVVPGVTVMSEGEKFRPPLAPDGMEMVALTAYGVVVDA
jgi:hypothetical protein